MRYLVVDFDRFNAVKDSFLRALTNEQLSSPYERAIKLTQYILTSRYWGNDELIWAVKSLGTIPCLSQSLNLLGIKANDVQTFIPKLLSKLHLETLVVGSTTKERALDMSNIVQEILGAKPLDLDSIDGSRSLLIPAGDT